MVQSPSWGASWFAASQEIPRISRNPKVHKRPPSKNYLRIVLSPEESSRMWVFLNRNVLQGGAVSTSPNHQARGPLLVGCPRLFIQFIRSYPHIGGRSSIHNPRTRHAVVTGTHYMLQLYTPVNKFINTFLLNTERHGTEFSCEAKRFLSWTRYFSHFMVAGGLLQNFGEENIGEDSM